MNQSATLHLDRAPRVLVVGDVMLDRYWHGDATRISPEAPVPVVKVTRVEDRLGGAANVAANVVALGGECTLLCIIGMDQDGSSLLAKCRAAGIFVGHILDEVPTTVKTRVVARHQQIVRVDMESEPSEDVVSALRFAFLRLIDHCDVLVLSDYAKGTLRDSQFIIQAARHAGKPVLVDPKGTDWGRYRGATLIKPNLAELKSVVGAMSDEAARNLRVDLNVDAILVTLGEAGMALHWDGDVIQIPADAREVFDVTGAGDTVIAAMAVAHPGSTGWLEDMRLASTAAGIVVGKMGTSIVTRAEVDSA